MASIFARWRASSFVLLGQNLVIIIIINRQEHVKVITNSSSIYFFQDTKYTLHFYQKKLVHVKMPNSRDWADGQVFDKQ